MNLSFKLKVERCRLSATRDGSTFNQRAALTLLEMMVAVTLLAVIMVGLLAMFQYTQRALHVAHTQTDVFENARGAIQLVARDLSEMSAFNDINVTNAYGVSNSSPVGNLLLVGPPSTNLPVYFEEAFWLTRVNDDWQGIAYFVDGINYGVGTLYRWSETARSDLAPQLIKLFTLGIPQPKAPHRVSDGIVHFSMEAVYVDRAPTSAAGKERYIRLNNFTFPLNESNALPVFIDLEIGVLEPATLKQFSALTNNPDSTIAVRFLQEHVGRIHFFRERVPIRNFINPYRENDLL